MEQRSLTIDAVEFGYGGVPLLRGIFLRVLSGEVVGLVGSNGCGKTTLMEIAAGQLLPWSGALVVDGRRFTRPSRTERFARIAYLPQEPMIPESFRTTSLLPSLTLEGQELIHAEIPTDHLDRRMRELSLGQRRLIEIVLVLALGRDYILMDEPFTGLDPLVCDRVISLVRSSAGKGSGILLSDHYRHHGARVVDRSVQLENGYCRVATR